MDSRSPLDPCSTFRFRPYIVGLKESRVLAGVHPWLAERVRFLGDIIEHFRGVQIYLSGFRTEQEQERLFRRSGRRPVAAPGCSQHQYGYAVDVAWGAIFEESALGDLNTAELAEQMSAWGRQLGLITVRGDPGHFQVFPGSEFRTWAVASEFCDPNPSLQKTAFLQYTDCLESATSDSRRAFCFQRWIGRQSQIQGITFTALPGRF